MTELKCIVKHTKHTLPSLVVMSVQVFEIFSKMRWLSLRRVLQIGDESVPLLLLFETRKHHFGARDVLLGVRQVNLKCVLAPRDTCRKKLYQISRSPHFATFHPVNISPLFLLASVYENPAAWPVWRPKRPLRLGPVLCLPPLSTVWHCEQARTKIFLPASTSPILVCWFGL